MKFIIDRPKWRCGGMNGHGEGPTHLLNEEGYKCCLGMIAQQLQTPEEELQGCRYPGEVERLRGTLLVDRLDGAIDSRWSPLSWRAMKINDQDEGFFSDDEREEALRSLFADHGHEIEFVGEYEREGVRR